MGMINEILNFSDVVDEYLPENQPNTYLNETFILNIIELIKDKGSTNSDVLNEIIKMERIHKQFVCGEITYADERKLFEEINYSFRNKYGVWLHETSECISFYNILNGSEVLSL